MEKNRVIVDYKNITPDIIELLTDRYPHGYDDKVIRFRNSKGETVMAVPLETEDTKYLVKMSTQLDEKVEAFILETDDDESSDLPPDDSPLPPPPDEDFVG